MPRVVIHRFDLFELFSDSKLGNHFAIALDVVCPQVIEQPPSFTDNFQQSAARPMVLLVRFEVLGEIRDALAKQSDLNFRGSRISSMDSILGNDVTFIFLCQTHSLPFNSFLIDSA